MLWQGSRTSASPHLLRDSKQLVVVPVAGGVVVVVEMVGVALVDGPVVELVVAVDEVLCWMLCSCCWYSNNSSNHSNNLLLVMVVVLLLVYHLCHFLQGLLLLLR